jgi:Txe/YoeB family toxin of Txe-Axe toxin-antitoxin module
MGFQLEQSTRYPGYTCPLCGSALSRERYERALRIKESEQRLRDAEQKATEKEIAKVKAQLLRAHGELKKSERDKVLAVKRARVEGLQDAERKTKAAMSNFSRKITEQQRTIAELKRAAKAAQLGVRPQEFGLMQQPILLQALQAAFRGTEDIFREAVRGKSEPDVFQSVRAAEKEIGRIVYELKNKSQLTAEDVRQTAYYQKRLNADAAILVTTADRSSFSGFDCRSGVIIVRPGGAVAVAQLCRNFLIEMAQLKIPDAGKKRVQRLLYQYVSGPECKKRLAQIEAATGELFQLLAKEIEFLKKHWSQQWNTLFVLSNNWGNLKENLCHIVSNETPVPFIANTPAKLRLLDLQGSQDRNGRRGGERTSP